MKAACRVTKHPKFGFFHLNPIPTENILKRFYKNQYYRLIRKGGRAPELRRLMAGGKTATQERFWLKETLYADVCYVLNKFARGKRVVDVGCGTGDLISYLQSQRLESYGIETSRDAFAIARSRKLNAFH